VLKVKERRGRRACGAFHHQQCLPRAIIARVAVAKAKPRRAPVLAAEEPWRSALRAGRISACSGPRPALSGAVAVPPAEARQKPDLAGAVAPVGGRMDQPVPARLQREPARSAADSPDA
jgi:hypothetical protein